MDGGFSQKEVSPSFCIADFRMDVMIAINNYQKFVYSVHVWSQKVLQHPSDKSFIIENSFISIEIITFAKVWHASM